MVQTEDAIREIEYLLDDLEKSLLDLQLPTLHARDRFAAEVLVTDVAWNATGTTTGPLDSRIANWHITEAEKRDRNHARIWSDYLGRVAYLQYAEFHVVDGQFSKTDPNEFTARVSFACLANTAQGLSHVQAKLSLVLKQASVAASSHASETRMWKVHAWKTASFQTTVRRQVLFEEVLDRVVDAPTADALRRSLHEEQSTRILLSQVPGNARTPRPFPTFDFSSWTRHPGLSVVDYNNDGFDDLFVARRTGPNTMLQNRGNGTFHDVTEQVQLTTDFEHPGFTNTVLFADFDNDGDQDAFVGRSLYGSRYYQNVGGRFKHSPESISVELPAHVVSLSAVDYNGDGLLDVYLSRYMPAYNGFNLDLTQHNRRDAVAELLAKNQPSLTKKENREFARRTWAAQGDLFRDAPGLANLLLKNVGNGRFQPAPEGKYLRVWRPTYQATWADYDNDGDADVYLANDFSPNHLFRNDGDKFTDVTATTGTADNGFGMGASWGDYDGDGRLDLYVTNMSSKAGRRITRALGDAEAAFAPMARGNSLFRQVDGRFTRVSGTTADTLPVELAGWGWGSQFVDVDNDGRLDIFAPAGYYTAPPEIRRPVDT